MEYKVTRQYARDVEMPLAEFNSLADMRFFAEVKLQSDAGFHVTAIYRLYQDNQLLDEINRGKINSAGVPARYFSDEDVQNIPLNAYQVVSQELANAPTPCANFIELKDARLFIENKLPADLAAKKKITYRILQSHQMLEKFDPARPVSQGSQQATASGNAANKTSFRPTPFNTVPRPPGSPQGWIKEAVGEKEEEK